MLQTNVKKFTVLSAANIDLEEKEAESDLLDEVTDGKDSDEELETEEDTDKYECLKVYRVNDE